MATFSVLEAGGFFSLHMSFVERRAKRNSFILFPVTLKFCLVFRRVVFNSLSLNFSILRVLPSQQ